MIDATVVTGRDEIATTIEVHAEIAIDATVGAIEDMTVIAAIEATTAIEEVMEVGDKVDVRAVSAAAEVQEAAVQEKTLCVTMTTIQGP